MSERRQFGRRTTCLHAWVKIPGRPQIACLVRNLSVGGALLEFDVPDWLPYRFRLHIEASGFMTNCETATLARAPSASCSSRRRTCATAPRS